MAREGGGGVGKQAPCATPGDETSPMSASSAGFELLLSSHYLQRQAIITFSNRQSNGAKCFKYSAAV